MFRLPPFTALPSVVLLLVQCLVQRVALVSLAHVSRLLPSVHYATQQTLYKHFYTLIAANSNNGYVVAHLSAVLILKRGDSHKYIIPY